MKKILTFALVLSLVLALAACGGGGEKPAIDKDHEESPSTLPENSNEIPSAPPGNSEKPAIDKDREGNPITLPEKIEKIMCFGPSNAEIIVAIGEGAKLIAIDTYSTNIEGIDPELPKFSMMTPDAEQILSLEPDLLFVTGMSKSGGDDPYKPISDAGVCVIYMPSSNSIEAIKEDIRYISEVLGQAAKGEELVRGMESKIEEIRKKGESVTDKKSVYFEIASAPNMYSFGTGVFLNEMIELIGATNILSDQDSWVSVSDEQIVSKNPDVILTSVNYIDDPVGEIESRPGWEAITAVANGDVCTIDTDASNRPNHNIVKALEEMAKAIYPDLYS